VPISRHRDGEPVRVRPLGRVSREDDRLEPDSRPGLSELVARAAEATRPASCPMCSGPDAFGRRHDPACLLA